MVVAATTASAIIRTIRTAMTASRTDSYGNYDGYNSADSYVSYNNYDNYDSYEGRQQHIPHYRGTAHRIFDRVTYCGTKFNIISIEFRSHFRKRRDREVLRDGGVQRGGEQRERRVRRVQ